MTASVPHIEVLSTRFKEAGLRFAESPTPYASGIVGHRIFGMSIGSRDTADECFLIWEGESTEISILDADPRRRQIVLNVRELQREFREDWVVEDDEDLARRLEAARARVISRVGHYVNVARRTPSEDRCFLLGQDETHYFIAQLPRDASSVDDAHAALRPEIAQRTGTLRQGEWFFVPLTENELRQVNEFILRARLDIIRRNASIDPNARGQPHVADELLRDSRPFDGAVFARGTIRQAPRHRPLYVGPRWVRAVRNLEVALSSSIDWID